MKKNKLFWILTVVCVLNFAAHLYFYPSLPDIVPTHWGASGQVNGWGPKSTVLILAALPFAMLILFEVIRKIDPKHQNFGEVRQGMEPVRSAVHRDDGRVQLAE